jgi:uncharacterized protein YegP (UPF0339 family)
MKKALFLFPVLLVLFATVAFAQNEKQPRAGRFEIQKSEQGKFFFVLKSSNGQEILKGFHYSTEDKANEAVDKVKHLVSDEVNFDIRSSGQQWYFFLKATDGRAVAQSEHYSTESAMKKGIESVKRTAPDAAIKPPTD